MIQKITTLYQTDRQFSPLGDAEDIQDFYKKRMSAEGIFLKGFDTEIKLSFKGKRSDGSHIFQMEGELEFSGKSFVVYTTPSKHIEIEYELISHKDNLILGMLFEKRQSLSERSDPRNDRIYGNVMASNFLISKPNTDISKITGVSSRVILADIHKALLGSYPQSKVVYVSNSMLNDEIEILKEFKKTIYILNSELMEAVHLPEIFDLKKSYEDDFILDEKVEEFKQKKKGSFLMFPIFIHLQREHLFAYLNIGFEKTPVPMEVYELYKEVEATFQSRIMDSNTYIFDVKQNVLNVSQGGVAIEVRNLEIIDSLKTKPSMTVDINFKMQAPLRMAVNLKHMEEVKDYFVIGAHIVGISGDKKAKDIYHSLIKFFG